MDIVETRTITQRAAVAFASDSALSTCRQLHEGDMIVSRTSYIISITICAFMTCVSLLVMATLLYREHARQQQAQAAKIWGRQSSVMKAIDDSYSTRFRGCLTSVPENPEMGSDSPVEIMNQDRVWEVAAEPAKVETAKNKRKSKAQSLFFDYSIGLWMPKR